ncbi:MAG: WbuC family cupin fold metalloprotein [Magnetococcales bacterium]|nr:WbuC family cupin fold metalloprotein [Magnetococcales bacterium]
MTALFPCEEVLLLQRTQVEEIKRLAETAPMRRARICLHHTLEDPSQEMLIAFCQDSYIRPHRHLRRSETFHTVEGEVLVVLFDDAGKVTRTIVMKEVGSGGTFLYRLARPLWHMLIPLTPTAVIHEIAPGPFVPEESEFAPWSPEPGDGAAVTAYVQAILASRTS